MSMNRASIESYINSAVTQPVKPWVDTEILNQYLSNVVKTDGLVHEAGTEEDAIRNDKALSLEGGQQKLKVFSDRITPKFAPLGRVIGEAEATMARLTALMLDPITAIPKGVNDVVDAQRAQWIWQSVGKSDAPATWLKALETDDLETARALLSVPGKPWVPADIRARGEEEFARRTSPELFAKRRSVEFLRDHLAAVAEMIRQWLVGLGANPDLKKTLNLK